MGRLLLLLLGAILVSSTAARHHHDKPKIFFTPEDLDRLAGDSKDEKEEKLMWYEQKSDTHDINVGSGEQHFELKQNLDLKEVKPDVEGQEPMVKEDVILAGKPLNVAADDKNKKENEILIETSLGPLPLKGKLPPETEVFYPVHMPTDFKSYDINNTDGYITLQELIDVTGASENVDEVFNACDKDGDGKLSPVEFDAAPWSLEGDPKRNSDPYALKEEIREEMMADGVDDPIVTLQEENWQPHKPPPFGLFG